MIRFTCPECGEVIQAPERLKQTEAVCSACDHRLTVPEHSQSPLPVLPCVDVNDYEEQRQPTLASAFGPTSGVSDLWKSALEDHRENVIWGLHRCAQCGATEDLRDYVFVRTVTGPSTRFANPVYYLPDTVIISGGTLPPRLGWACQPCVDRRRTQAFRMYVPVAIAMVISAVFCATFVADAIRQRLHDATVHYGRIILPFVGGAFATVAAMFLIGAILRHLRYRAFAGSVLVAEHAERRIPRNANLGRSSHAEPVVDEDECRARLSTRREHRLGVVFEPHQWRAVSRHVC